MLIWESLFLLLLDTWGYYLPWYSLNYRLVFWDHTKKVDWVPNYLRSGQWLQVLKGRAFFFFFLTFIPSPAQDRNMFLWFTFAGWVSILVRPFWGCTSPGPRHYASILCEFRLCPCPLWAMQFRVSIKTTVGLRVSKALKFSLLHSDLSGLI